jgi:hypothetical protein
MSRKPKPRSGETPLLKRSGSRRRERQLLPKLVRSSTALFVDPIPRDYKYSILIALDAIGSSSPRERQ